MYSLGDVRVVHGYLVFGDTNNRYVVRSHGRGHILETDVQWCAGRSNSVNVGKSHDKFVSIDFISYRQIIPDPSIQSWITVLMFVWGVLCGAFW